MRYFVFWSVKNYIPGSFDEFATREELEAFLNGNAIYGPDFEFTIIEGRKLEANPVEVVKQYRIK